MLKITEAGGKGEFLGLVAHGATIKNVERVEGAREGRGKEWKERGRRQREREKQRKRESVKEKNSGREKQKKEGDRPTHREKKEGKAERWGRVMGRKKRRSGGT